MPFARFGKEFTHEDHAFAHGVDFFTPCRGEDFVAENFGYDRSGKFRRI